VSLNIEVREQILTGLTATAMLLVIAALVTGGSGPILLAVLAVGLTVAGDWRFSRWMARSRGWWFAVGTVPLRLMYYALNVLSAGLGLLQACAARRLPTALPAASGVRQADKSPA
jgi:hypothetical protein